MSSLDEDNEKQTIYSFQSIAPDAREESDSLGSVSIPAGALWGAHTQRALQNFPISGYPISKHPSFIVAYLKVKLACAEANHAAGELDDEQLEAVEWAAENLIGAIVDGTPAPRLDGLQTWSSSSSPWTCTKAALGLLRT